MKPHKHAELIKAWADGACVQGKDVFGQWVEIADIWTGNEYRIKPEEKKPVVRWLWAYNDYEYEWREWPLFMSETEAEKCFAKSTLNFKKLEYTRTEFEE